MSQALCDVGAVASLPNGLLSRTASVFGLGVNGPHRVRVASAWPSSFPGVRARMTRSGCGGGHFDLRLRRECGLVGGAPALKSIEATGGKDHPEHPGADEQTLEETRRASRRAAGPGHENEQCDE